MFSQKGNHMRFLFTILLLLSSILTVQGQDATNDAARNKRMAATSGGWYTGGVSTSLISIGQNGVSTMLTATDGQTEYKGNFGFVLPLVEQVEPNQAPIAITSTRSTFFDVEDILGLDGFDPDGDDIQYVITQQPERVTLSSDGLNPGEFRFTPLASLTPANEYKDTIRFKVVEVNGEKLESDIAIFPFNFNVVDEAHRITDFTVTNNSETTKSFEITLTDNRFNSNYLVSLSYYAPLTAEPIAITTNANFLLSNLTAENNTLKTTIGVNRSEHPTLFTAEAVLVEVDVVTPSFSDFNVLAFTNTNNAAAGGNRRDFESDEEFFNDEDKDGDKTPLESFASNDGLFIGFNKKKKTLEKTSVQVKMTAVELGGFSLADAKIQISSDPKKGTLSKPILEKVTEKIVQWTATYTPTAENGYEDNFEFTVLSDSRKESVSTIATVEVVDVNSPPNLSAIAGQKINEEQNTTIDLNFSDVDSELNLTATSSNASNVAVSTNGKQLSIVPAANFNGTVSIRVLVEEKGTAESYSKFETFEVEVVPVNDAPIMAAINNQSINEDNVFTYTFSATDVDARIPLFNFRATPDITGAATVSINGNTLTVTPAPNYNGTINFNVTADDRLGTSTSVSAVESFSLVVNSVNDAPVSTANIPAQNMLDILPAYILDLGQYFEDVETADANLRITNNATGTLFTLTTVGDKVTVSPIQGQAGTENVTFTISDGELSVTQTVAFTVQANSTTITSSNIAAVNLNEDFNTHTVDLSGVFTDTGDPNAVFTYTVGGLSNITGSINGNNLVLTGAANYSGSENVFLIASANGKSSFTTFSIKVNPVNDAPTLGTVSNQSIQEDTQLNGLFMTFEDIDTDASNLTFTATSSNEALIATSGININKSTGGIVLTANPLANVSGSTTVTVSVSDGEFTATKQFAISVLSVNDVPTVSSTTIAGATEDAAYSQSLAGLFSDVDGDNLTYAIEGGPAWLKISNGNLTGTPTNDNVGLNSFFINANDGEGGSVRQRYTINVVNTNDAPVVATATLDIAATEDVLLSSFIPSNIFSDVDGDELTLSASFTGASWLSFDATNRRFTGTPTNDDVGTVNITITATDPSGATVSDDVVLTVANTNDSPTDVAISGLSIDENSSIGAILGTLSSTDVDAGDSFTYSLVSGAGATNNDLFSISSGNLVTNSAIDFEATATLSVRVKTADAAGASFEKTFTITVNNVNEAPTALAVSNLALAENAGANAEIGSISSSDPDNGDTFSYSLVAGTGDTDNASFDISNGKLVAKNSFNFESKSTYSLRLKTVDAGGLSYEEAVAVSVTNVNEAPTEVSISAASIDENSAIGTVIGVLSTTDEDSGDTFTYTLASATSDNDSFAIDGSNLITGVAIDFEAKASYSVVVTTTDAAGASFNKNITIDVNNVTELSIAAIEGLTFETIDIDETATKSFTVDNTGDTEIAVTNISLPNGYSADQTTFTVAVGSSQQVVVTFDPDEAITYAGEIVMTSNLGETRISVTGEGTIITAIDDDIIDSEEVSLYPNPAQHTVTIDLTLIPQVQPNLAIIDLNGNALWTKEKVQESKVEVNVSSYPAGTYLVRIASDKGSVVKKLIIVK